MLTPAKYWREIPQRYRLEAARCTGCKKIFFPPRLVCDECGGEAFETLRLPDEGKVVSYTVIHTPASNFSDEAPLAAGVIDLGDGVKISAQIADCAPDELKVGMAVRIEFRRIQEAGGSGVLCYGYKVVPAK